MLAWVLIFHRNSQWPAFGMCADLRILEIGELDSILIFKTQLSIGL